MMVSVVGWVAAALTTFAFVPQVLRTLRTRDVAGISTGMYAAFCAGVALWLAYGFMIHFVPIVGANAVTLALALTVLALTVTTRRRASRHGRANGALRNAL